MHGTAVGISVSGPDKEFVEALAKAIRDSAGIPVAITPGASATDITRIFVGAKNPGYFH